MSAPPRINLPLLPEAHAWADHQLQFFYDTDGKLVIPPSFFNHLIDRNLGRLTCITTDEDGATKPGLTEIGRQWTDDAWPAFPFFDRDQRDELHRPFHKYEKTCENKLKFARHMQTYFSTSLDEFLMFSNHINTSLQTEVVHRCVADGKTLPNGDEPRTIQDVLTILKSDEMKHLFDTDKDKLYDFIFRWIKSVTFEDSISWVEDAINDYFRDNGMMVRMASGQTKKTRRHSIVRIAVDKGTQTIKEKFKYMEEKAYGWKLDMSLGVHPNSKDQAKLRTYLERMASDNYSLVHLDPSIVPKSRKKNPVYWLKKTGTVDADPNEEPNISGMLDVIVNAASSSHFFSVGELFEMLQEKVTRQEVEAISEPLNPNVAPIQNGGSEIAELHQDENVTMADQMDTLFVRYPVYVDC